jgi:hypothetical protein
LRNDISEYHTGLTHRFHPRPHFFHLCHFLQRLITKTHIPIDAGSSTTWERSLSKLSIARCSFKRRKRKKKRKHKVGGLLDHLSYQEISTVSIAAGADISIDDTFYPPPNSSHLAPWGPVSSLTQDHLAPT